MAFTNRTAQAVLNALFGKTSNFGALASAPTLYVALSTTTPTEAGANVTEPSGGGYARVATGAADWAAATLADPSSINNAEIIDFGTASGSWSSGANMTHAVLYDAASSGNVVLVAALATPKPVTNGDPVSFPVGDLAFTLD